jgi:hypothetical protein
MLQSFMTGNCTVAIIGLYTIVILCYNAAAATASKHNSLLFKVLQALTYIRNLHACPRLNFERF